MCCLGVEDVAWDTLNVDEEDEESGSGAKQTEEEKGTSGENLRRVVLTRDISGTWTKKSFKFASVRFSNVYKGIPLCRTREQTANPP